MYRRAWIPMMMMVIVLNGIIVVSKPAAAATYFKLIPTPTGSCPLNPTTADAKNPSGTEPYECVNGLCKESGQIRGGDDLPCNYSLCDFLQLFVNGMNILITISGAVALIILIWGAQGFIMAGGSDEKVTASKTLMKNAAIGLLIILVSWQLIAIIVNFLVPRFSDIQTQTGFQWNLLGNVQDLCPRPPR